MARAQRLAHEHGLRPGTWVYIPYTEPHRALALQGLRVSREELLIGFFSDRERYFLCGRWATTPASARKRT